MSASLPRPAGGNANIGPNLEAAALVTVIVAVIVVSARFYARARIVRSVGIDDWLMLLALCLAITSTGTEIYAVENGFGRHLYYLTSDPSATVVIGKYLTLSGAFCNLALMFAKLSICVTLLRILHSTHERGIKVFLWFFAFTILAVNVSVTATAYAQCTPVQRVWNKAIHGTCWDPAVQRGLSYLQGAYSAFTDFVLAGLPVVVFRHLHMSKASRNALIIVMSLGTATGALAIARTVETWRYSQVDDSTWTSVTLLMLSALERNFAIILASVPATRPLFRNMDKLGSMTASLLHRRTHQSGSKAESDGTATSGDTEGTRRGSFDSAAYGKLCGQNGSGEKIVREDSGKGMV